jgi:hypothetical protein
VAADASSVIRYGLTRRAALSTNTTSAAQSGVQRDAALADRQQPPARATIGVNALYDASGGRWPLWAARAGDTITIRSLPPTLSTDIDRIRSFRISRTEYDVDNDTITIEPEAPLQSLEVMVARAGERL